MLGLDGDRTLVAFYLACVHNFAKRFVKFSRNICISDEMCTIPKFCIVWWWARLVHTQNLVVCRKKQNKTKTEEKLRKIKTTKENWALASRSQDSMAIYCFHNICLSASFSFDSSPFFTSFIHSLHVLHFCTSQCYVFVVVFFWCFSLRAWVIVFSTLFILSVLRIDILFVLLCL